MLIEIKDIFGYTNWTSKIATTKDTNPADREYINETKLPTIKDPSVVLTTIKIIASIGPNMNSVTSVNMLDKPIFAPGRNSGGNRLSSIKDIKLSAVNMPIVATRFALNLNVLDTVFIIPLNLSPIILSMHARAKSI